MKITHSIALSLMFIVLSLAAFLPAAYGATDKDGMEKRTYLLKNFNSITNVYSVNVVYTQSNTYSVAAEGTPAALDAVDISVADGTLSVNRKQNGQQNFFTGEITLHVVAPDIKAICNDGNFSFTSNGFTSTSLEIDNNGAMEISTGKVRCGKLNIRNDGYMKAKGLFEAKSVQFGNNGACDLSADFITSGNICFANRGNLEYAGRLSAFISYMDNSGAGRYDADVKAEHTSITANGNMTGKVKINGGKVNISSGGAMKVDIELDCESVTVNCNGYSRLTLSGTADYVELTGKGTSSIDTKGLNKF